MSKAQWSIVRLDELKANKPYALNGGPFGSNLVRADYRPEGVPVIRGGDISGDRAFSYDDLVFVSEEKADELRPNNAHPGDLIFTQRGTLGQVGMIPRNAPFPRFVISQSQMKLTVNEDVADPHFLYCYFRAPSTIQTIHNLAFSSGVPHINLDILRNFEVLLPPLPTQRKIAAILSAYDDLTEVNTRRIALLEEMARGLYREWFVRFRFPGHERVRMVESAVGLVPEGWEVVKTGDAIDVNPPTKVPADGEKPSVMMNGISTNMMLITETGYRSGNSGSKFKNGDTLFARITPCLENGKTAFVQFLPTDDAVACGSTEFIVLRSRTLCPEFVYLLARSDAFRDNAIKSMTGASGRQRVQEACFDKFLFAHPDQKTLTAFAKLVSPLFPMVQLLADKNAEPPPDDATCCCRGWWRGRWMWWLWITNSRRHTKNSKHEVREAICRILGRRGRMALRRCAHSWSQHRQLDHGPSKLPIQSSTAPNTPPGTGDWGSACRPQPGMAREPSNIP